MNVYVSPNLGDALDDVAWHEAAHVYDFLSMTEATRTAWRVINRRTEGGWWAGPDPPGEQFAESYRMCVLHTRDFATYGYYPGPKRLARTCAMLRRAGALD